MDWNTPETMFALFTIFSGLMLWMMSRLEGRMDAMGSRVDAMGTRIDAQGARTDQAIAMIMEMQKEIKELYKNPPKA